MADNIIPAGASAQVVRPMQVINKQAMCIIQFFSAKTPFLVCIIFVTTVTTFPAHIRMFNSHGIIPIMQAIKQARLPAVHAHLKRGELRDSFAGIRVFPVHCDQTHDAGTPLPLVTLDRVCLPGARKHILQLAPTPHICVIAWVGHRHPA